MQLSLQNALIVLPVLLLPRVLAAPLAFPSKDNFNLISALSSRSPIPFPSLTAREEDAFKGIQDTLDQLFDKVSGLSIAKDDGAGQKAGTDADQAGKNLRDALVGVPSLTARQEDIFKNIQDTLDKLFDKVSGLDVGNNNDGGAGQKAGNSADKAGSSAAEKNRRDALIGVPGLGALDGALAGDLLGAGGAAAAAEGIAKGIEGAVPGLLRP